jgi:hypothetical protein
MSGWRAFIGHHPGGASISARLTAIIVATGAVLAVLGAATLPALAAATITVTTTQDSGPGSLREALALAGDGMVTLRVMASSPLVSVITPDTPVATARAPPISPSTAMPPAACSL